MAILEVNLNKIINNYNKLKSLSGSAKCAAVVKANCYGLGDKEICLKLEKENCQDFFVATINEAISLRKYIKEANIYILNGPNQNEISHYKNYNLTAILNNQEQIDYWQETNLPCNIHLDTGMNRLGVKNIRKDELRNLNIQYIMSHLACGDEKNNPYNLEQLNKFENFYRENPEYKYSLANSSGIFLGKNFRYDMVRAGCALYGINPCDKNNMENIVTLKAKIINISNIDSQEYVGYGATYRAKHKIRLATLGIGYADGYNRLLGNRSYVYFKKHKIPVIGRISMDLVTIDITNIADNEIENNMYVELINNHIDVNIMAKLCNTIGYEILTSIGNRVKREYIS